MLKKMIIILCLVSLLFTGCRRGDIKVEMVFKGQPVPFDGYNVGPDIYRLQGEPAIMTGWQVWGKGIDPNELFE